MKPAAAIALLLAAACGKAAPPSGGKDPGFGQSGTVASHDMDALLDEPSAFYDLPYPSDLRLDAAGAPRVGSFPNPKGLPIIEGFKKLARERRGFPVLPVAYFRFSAPLQKRDAPELIAPSATAPALLLDVDPSSPEAGRAVPVVVATPPADDYVPPNTLAIAPRPGFVLSPKRTYAFVVLRSLNDAAGKPLGVSPALDRLRAGQVPDGDLGERAKAVYAPLWDALRLAGVDGRQVAAATVFTTGDAVAETSALAAAMSAKHAVSLDGLSLSKTAPPNDRVCVLEAKVRYPQFQRGLPPFNTEGSFQPGADGLPAQQRVEEAPAVLTIPKAPMPAGGFPLLLYFHGSGGSSADVIDKGPTLTKGGDPVRGRGPAWVHAPSGFAAAGSALPVNPERLAGAGETAYLNLLNPAAMRDTFRQGIVEQRLFLDALLKLQLSPESIAGCDGPSLPAGATAFKFDAANVIAQGQSMGGMYTNLIAATDPRIRLAIPTGAGGFWTYFILVTNLYSNVGDLLALLLGTAKGLTALHPALHLIETGWEPADPIVSMPRLGRRPLAGHPVRPVYQPAAKGDEYFSTVLYDAMALAYGHQEAGAQVWPSMQDALALDSLHGLLNYPVQDNRVSEAGARYTGAVVQYEGDGIEDPHAIYRQLDAVKRQYRCFAQTFLVTGRATLVGPGAVDSNCL